MTPDSLITMVVAFCGGAGTIITLIFATGRWTSTTTNAHENLSRELDELKESTSEKFENAGREMSKAMSYVQGLESRFMREFASRDLTDERFAENRRDRELLRAELSILKAEQTLLARERRSTRPIRDNH